jgi:hypothetical protein
MQYPMNPKRLADFELVPSDVSTDDAVLVSRSVSAGCVLAVLSMVVVLNLAGATVLLEDGFEGSQPFTDGSPPGTWVRGTPAAYWEAYSSGGGILDRGAADLGTNMVSLNPISADAWIYRDTGAAFAPNTTYTGTLYAGSHQNTAFQQGGVIEVGLWSGIPAQPQTQAPLPPDRAGGHRADTSSFPGETMVKVATYSFTTGSDVTGMGNIVVFVRNLASGNGRSSVDAITVEADGQLPNRFKYAYNMAPMEGDLLLASQPRNLIPGGTHGLPVLFLDPANHEPTLQFVRRKEVTDPRIQYEPQHAVDLTAGWNALTASGIIESIDSTWNWSQSRWAANPRAFCTFR